VKQPSYQTAPILDQILFKLCNNRLRLSVKNVLNAYCKALQNWKISVKALTKRLWKLTISTKRLKILSFPTLTINKQFLTKIGGNNEF